MRFIMQKDELSSLSKEELIARVLILEEENKDLGKKAITDGLTGLHNRASYDDHIEKQIAIADRFGHSLSLLVIDLDKFKDVNDTYGHQVGDEVLKQSAEMLEEMSRNSDMICRFGGEEFVLILPDTSRANGAIAAEYIRKKFEAHEYTAPSGEKFNVTTSIGVSSFIKGDTPKTLFEKADTGVYAAKDAGRNNVQVHSNADMSQSVKKTTSIKENLTEVDLDDSGVSDIFDKHQSEVNSTNTSKKKTKLKMQ